MNEVEAGADNGHQARRPRAGDSYMGSYEALVETLDVVGDPEAMEQLRISAEQIRAGKTQPIRELGKELGFEE